ncbi:MAG: recombinase zinc beta ribbon domain-containing protein, partial [Anaerolineales bacterium]
PYTSFDVPSDGWIFIAVPALVSDDLFEAAKEQLAENRRRYRQSRRGPRHLLQGLLICERCGFALYASSTAAGKTRAYAYYRCTGMDAYRFGGQRICANKPMRTEPLEDAVWQDVRSLLADPHRVEEEYRRRLASRADDLEGCLEQVQKQMQNLKRGMARIADAYEEGWLDKADFEQRMGRARDRLAHLQSQAQEIADQEAQRRELRLVIGQLGDFARRVAGGLQEADWAARRDLIRALVKEIRVAEDRIRIVYRVSPPPPAQAAAPGSSPGSSQDCRRAQELVER